jgi:hypothetical protein
MDRYKILLKKKPGKTSDSFFKMLRDIFGTKYPIKVFGIKSGEPITSVNENFLFYDIKHEMFVSNDFAPNGIRLQLKFFSLGLYAEKIKAAFKAVQSAYHFKFIQINNWSGSGNVIIELVLDLKKPDEYGRADYDSRPGYGRSED